VERVLWTAREMCHITYKGKVIIIATDFSEKAKSQEGMKYAIKS
jgi:hypothetical protein